jgi:hypothetical protein
VPAVAVSLLFGLRGDVPACAEWRERAFAFADTRNLGELNHVAGLWMFTLLRLAVHAGDLESVGELTDQVLSRVPRWSATRRFYDSYVWAAAVEVAALGDRPNAGEYLLAAQPAADENDWAAACLARVRGRLTGDPAAFAAAVDGFERIGAEFERACTLLLTPDCADEGRAEMERLGCALPAVPSEAVGDGYADDSAVPS